jgi:isochorismate synthase
MGALAFDGADHLHVPARVRRSGPRRVHQGETSRGVSSRPVTPGFAHVEFLQEVPSRNHYALAVEAALLAIARGSVEKVVLARAVEVLSEAPLDASAIVRRLFAANRAAYVFGVPLPGGRTLVGASPELLVSLVGGRVIAHPLAGSSPRGMDPDEDEARRGALLGSEKDRREHAYVADAVASALRPLCTDLDVPQGPSTVRTPAVWHLSTRIEGTPRPGIGVLDLVAALHPTPAICGTPTDAAARLIKDLEEEPRGFYAGAVGWADSWGEGEWAVTIRSAEIAEKGARVHAGAGIVAGSDPWDELDETTAKLRTMLRALGLDTDLSAAEADTGIDVTAGVA